LSAKNSPFSRASARFHENKKEGEEGEKERGRGRRKKYHIIEHP
jgi:hypothetical protein